MKSYGETVREIRLKKGIKQKELYQDILSKSFAIQFEKGEHEVVLSTFEQLLERLGVEFEEFKLIQREYRSDEIRKLNHHFSIAANNYDVKSLYKLKTKLEEFETKGSASEILRLQIQLVIGHIFKNQGIEFSKIEYGQDVEKIQAYLLSKETWFLQEIKLYLNVLPHFQYELNMYLMPRVLKSMDSYQESEEHKFVLSLLLCNFLSVVLEKEEQVAQDIVPYFHILDELTKDPMLALERTVYLFILGKYEYKMEKQRSGLIKMKQAISVMEILDYPSFVQGMAHDLKEMENTRVFDEK